MKWQPMETAPLDGTEIIVLLNVASVEVAHIAWFRSVESWEEEGQFCGGWDSVEDWTGWWSYVRNSVSQEKLEGCHTPIAWIPMPAAL